MVMVRIEWTCDVRLAGRTIVMTMQGMPPPELRGNARGHWGKRHRASRQLKEKGWVFAKTVNIKYPDLRLPLSDAEITYTFVKQGRGDVDNFAIGMKPFLDGLITGGLLIDDDYLHLSHGKHQMRYGKPVVTEVRVEELNSE